MADLDFDSKPVQDFIAMLAKKQIVIDPTLSTFEFLRQRAGQVTDSYAPVADAHAARYPARRCVARR